SIGYKKPEHFTWMKTTGVQPGEAILDVGCGNGSLLSRLYRMGFTNLTGIDPFINASHDEGPINIYRKSIEEVDQKFDLIMMHHSLEHMLHPQEALKKAYSLLPPGRFLLVRIPIMGHYGWHTYKT